jgi:hypothetical protein
MPQTTEYRDSDCMHKARYLLTSDKIVKLIFWVIDNKIFWLQPFKYSNHTGFKIVKEQWLLAKWEVMCQTLYHLQRNKLKSDIQR